MAGGGRLVADVRLIVGREFPKFGQESLPTSLTQTGDMGEVGGPLKRAVTILNRDGHETIPCSQCGHVGEEFHARPATASNISNESSEQSRAENGPTLVAPYNLAEPKYSLRSGRL